MSDLLSNEQPKAEETTKTRASPGTIEKLREALTFDERVMLWEVIYAAEISYRKSADNEQYDPHVREGYRVQAQRAAELDALFSETL